MSSLTASPALKIAQIVCAIIFCLFCAGVIFGFAALKPVLIQEGIYADLCEPGERHQDEDGNWNVCLGQDTRLNLMFTLATVITNVVCLPVGYTLDHLGPRKTSILGSVVFGIGAFFFGLGYRSSFIDSYILGFIFLGVGGPLIFLSQFHLSNAFPAYSGVVLAAITGAFDASSIPFVFYRMMYNASGGALNLRIFFWSYLIMPVLVIIEHLTISPPETYQRLVGGEEEEPSPVVEPDAVTSTLPSTATTPVNRRSASRVRSEAGTELSNTAVAVEAFSAFSRIHYGDAHEDDEGMIKELAHKDGVTGLLYGQTAAQQIKSKWWVLLTLFVCIHMTRINFYVMSIDSQLEYYLGDAVLAEKLTIFFTICLPAGGAVAIPFIGLLLDYRPFMDVLGVLMAMGILFGSLGMTTVAWSQLIGIVIFCVFRPLMYTVVSDAYAKVFGFQTFGTVYGLSMTLSGCTGLINAPLDLLVKTKLHDNFYPIGITFVILGILICSSLMFSVWRYTRKGSVQLA
ncbi:MFS general substrate transporter [Meredithblackwellia eburnea MCA 4105]